MGAIRESPVRVVGMVSVVGAIHESPVRANGNIIYYGYCMYMVGYDDAFIKRNVRVMCGYFQSLTHGIFSDPLNAKWHPWFWVQMVMKYGSG